MDLAQLKSNWDALNATLTRTEIVNRRVVSEIIASKTQSAYVEICKSAKQGLFATLLVGGLFPLLNQQLHFTPAAFILIEAVTAIGLLYQLYILHTLRDDNIATMKSTEALRMVTRYQQLYIWNVKYGLPIILLAILVFFWLQNGFGPYSILALASTIAVWSLVALRQHRRHIGQIEELKRNLEELDEFR